MLAFYRTMLKLRRDTEELRTGRSRFFDVAEPVLAFTRGGTVLCLFNLSPEKHAVRVTGGGALALAQGAEHGEDGRVTLHPNGFAIMEATEGVEVGDLPPKPPDVEAGDAHPPGAETRGSARGRSAMSAGRGYRIGTPFSSKRWRSASIGRMPIWAPQGIVVLPSWRTSTGSSEPMSTKR